MLGGCLRTLTDHVAQALTFIREEIRTGATTVFLIAPVLIWLALQVGIRVVATHDSDAEWRRSVTAATLRVKYSRRIVGPPDWYAPGLSRRVACGNVVGFRASIAMANATSRGYDER